MCRSVWINLVFMSIYICMYMCRYIIPVLLLRVLELLTLHINIHRDTYVHTIMHTYILGEVEPALGEQTLRSGEHVSIATHLNSYYCYHICSVCIPLAITMYK